MLNVRPVLIALAAALPVACSTPHPPAEPAAAPTVDVRTTQADLTELATPIEAGGVVRARLTAAIAARVMAPIAEVHVRPGDRVRRGQTLVTLDSREVAANRTRAAAGLDAAEQGATAAEAARQGADAAVKLAQATYDRVAGLAARKSATPQELDEAVAALAGATARAAAARAQVAEARAALDAARAGSEGATVAASYTTLTAPFDGVVTERMADPGAMAAPGMPLLSVEDATGFRLESRLDEARAASVAIGDRAAVRVDSVSDTWTEGRVAEIARLDPMSHSFLVKIDLPPSPGLRSGLYGSARFAGARRKGISLPAAALVPRGQLTFVYAIDQNSIARLRPVSAAAVMDDRAEILAGVSPGERIVVSPPPALTDGVKVRTGASR